MRCLPFSCAPVAACALLSFTSIFVIPAEVAWACVTYEATLGADEVEFWAAIESKEIDVTMIPRDSRRVTLQVKNNTDRPLAIRLPHAFAGVPVLAQPGGFGFPGGGGGAGGGAQALGMGFPGGGGNLGGIMNVPPGKVIKVKRASVCLEHGKPEPRPRLPYKIVPLEEFSDDDALRELLTVLAHDKLNQRVAQIAAWHFANNMSWEELAGLTIKHLNGRRTPRFTLAEIRAAQQLAAALPSQQKESSDPHRDSLSRR